MSFSLSSRLDVLRGVGLFGFSSLVLGDLLLFTDVDGSAGADGKTALLISGALLGVNLLVNVGTFPEVI